MKSVEEQQERENRGRRGRGREEEEGMQAADTRQGGARAVRAPWVLGAGTPCLAPFAQSGRAATQQETVGSGGSAARHPSKLGAHICRCELRPRPGGGSRPARHSSPPAWPLLTTSTTAALRVGGGGSDGGTASAAQGGGGGESERKPGSALPMQTRRGSMQAMAMKLPRAGAPPPHTHRNTQHEQATPAAALAGSGP